MDIISRFETLCQESPRRIVLPEGSDVRILQAASLVAGRSLAEPTVMGPPDEIREIAGNKGIDLAGVSVVDPDTWEMMDDYIDEYVSMRATRRVTRQIAARVLSKSLMLGAMMVRMGDADGLVAGATNLTATVIKAGKLLIGLKDRVGEPSSFFIMVVPGLPPLVFADCAVNPDPDAELLAQIAISSACSARDLLDVEPRVAMLSFSTKGSASHPDVSKVAKATGIARSLAPDLRLDGELQADAAIVPEIAVRKRAEGILGGRANVLIFPDLDAGNIAYKLVQHLAHANAYGPFMQGFRRPINDLSRGASVEEIIGTILVTSLQARVCG